MARASAALPLGALLVLAAVRHRASTARDLDELLAGLVSDPTGRVLVWLVAGGFLVLACYSLVEVRYRRVDAGD